MGQFAMFGVCIPRVTILAELRALANSRLVQTIALALLLAVLAGLTIASKSPVLDADVWWHLKVGDWIVEQHAFPHVGVFSRTAATRPWMAYSWAHEVLLSRAYAWFGLMGLASFGVLLTGAVAAVFFWRLYRISGRFWVAWGLCAAGSVSFLFNLLPRPVFFSMMFFSVTLSLVLEAHRTARVRPLYWLPLLFVFWANFHIQFIYGLFVVGLFAGMSVLRPVAARLGINGDLLPSPALRAEVLLGILAACAAACCIGPYSYHLLEVVFKYSMQRFPYAYIQELQPLDFKHPSDYVLVLLLIGAVATVIRRRDLTAFKLVLLAVATLFAFRALRDAWFLGISAALCLADPPTGEPPRPQRFKATELAAVAMAATLLLLLVARITGFNARSLDRTISAAYPVDAVNFLRRHPLPGPIYNDFSWGGFLIWYMPNYPVAVDGRTDLYGDEIEMMMYKSVAGDYASDPYLKEARLVLLRRETPLATMLTADPRFRLVYADRLAVVLARNP